MNTPLAGDALFCGGCGALFECSALVLHDSLQTLVRHRLQPSTMLFPGHEYTEMLLQQALKRDPQNEAARRKYEEVRRVTSRRPYARATHPWSPVHVNATRGPAAGAHLRPPLGRPLACQARAVPHPQTRLKRARKQPSLPSTVAEELEYNTHLRATPEELALLCGCAAES